MATCLVSGCPVLVPSGRCAAHQVKRKPWSVASGDKPARLTGRPLRRMRRQLFQREPLCQPCKANGRVTIATIRDHVRPLAEGGTDTEDNVQAICADCHQEKTKHESIRGQRRQAWG